VASRDSIVKGNPCIGIFGRLHTTEIISLYSTGVYSKFFLKNSQRSV
jgi:hypothetical protein